MTNTANKPRHLLSIEDLNYSDIEHLFQLTDSMIDKDTLALKKMASLDGVTVMSLFFEPSTRTRTSFEIAARRLSADYYHIDIKTSATHKGESLLDTVYNLQAMQADMFIVRHNVGGTPPFIAQTVAPHVSVINAGDGSNAHPTQALLDMYTIRHHKGNFENLSVAIVGDVFHSRVARSQLQALTTLGVKDIRVIGPQVLIPKDVEHKGVTVFHDIESGLQEADVVVTLRLQKERFANPQLPTEEEYFNQFGLTGQRLALAKPDAIVMHPGPMNRGVEIASDVADGAQSVILQQVTFGVATRMAVMSYLR